MDLLNATKPSWAVTARRCSHGQHPRSSARASSVASVSTSRIQPIFRWSSMCSRATASMCLTDSVTPSPRRPVPTSNSRHLASMPLVRSSRRDPMEGLPARCLRRRWESPGGRTTISAVLPKTPAAHRQNATGGSHRPVGASHNSQTWLWSRVWHIVRPLLDDPPPVRPYRPRSCL